MKLFSYFLEKILKQFCDIIFKLLPSTKKHFYLNSSPEYKPKSHQIFVACVSMPVRKLFLFKFVGILLPECSYLHLEWKTIVTR